MFMNLDADVAHRLEATTMASFLEIYGEDVYDLLSDGHAPGTKRASLQASAGGGAAVVALVAFPLKSFRRVASGRAHACCRRTL